MDQHCEELNLVRRFFPEIAGSAGGKLAQLARLLREWNERVNLISRKDVEHIEEHHLLHALTITRVFFPHTGCRIADLGTGGGFPGLPLAVLYPNCHFTLVDSIAKKGRAVRAMADELGLQNVTVVTARAETLRGRFDFVTGRAVTALPTFLGWAAPLLRQPGAGGDGVKGGVLYFKGTLWKDEVSEVGITPTHVWPLDGWVDRPFFKDKFLLHFAPPIRLNKSMRDHASCKASASSG